MNGSFECVPKHDFDLAANAKVALESVCSGKALDSLSRYYSQEFVDHVNHMKFKGLEGARLSVESYTKILSDLEVVVEEQLTDGDRGWKEAVVGHSDMINFRDAFDSEYVVTRCNGYVRM